MRSAKIIASALLPFVSASVLPRTTSPGALYFLDNNPSGASVVALQISAADGTLSKPVRTATGGAGQLSLTATGVSPNADNLFSQDAVVVSGKRLFTISPGSNTLSLFTISPDDPTILTLVGTPISTGGTFPNSVAFSHALHIACVLNTGATAGVSCFHVDDQGLTPMGSFMPLPVKQTSTPPTGPPNTASDIVFNPSSTALFVTIKGDGTNPGYIYVYRVSNGAIDPEPVVSRPPELLLDFSLSFMTDSRAAISDPAYGASFVQVDYPSLAVTVTKKVVITGERAICWTAYSDRFGAVFLLDAGNPNITALDPATGDIKYTIAAPASTLGSFDTVVSGAYLYVLQSAAGVSVFSLKGSVGNGKVPTLVQNLDLSGLGSRQGWQGLAAYPN